MRNATEVRVNAHHASYFNIAASHADRTNLEPPYSYHHSYDPMVMTCPTRRVWHVAVITCCNTVIVTSSQPECANRFCQFHMIMRHIALRIACVARRQHCLSFVLSFALPALSSTVGHSIKDQSIARAYLIGHIVKCYSGC